MNIYAYIYLITCLITGKVYIGFTSRSIEERWKEHISDMRRYNSPLYRAMRKHGIENFTIREIDRHEDKEHCLKVLEPYYIKQYKSNNKKIGYNLTIGGEGCYGFKHSEEAIERMKARIHSEESKRKMRESRKGMKFTEEHRKNITLARLGKKSSKESIENHRKAICKTWKFLHNNQVTIIDDLRTHCREKELNYSCMRAVFYGQNKQHRGYTRFTE